MPERETGGSRSFGGLGLGLASQTINEQWPGGCGRGQFPLMGGKEKQRVCRRVPQLNAECRAVFDEVGNSKSKRRGSLQPQDAVSLSETETCPRRPRDAGAVSAGDARTSRPYGAKALCVERR